MVLVVEDGTGLSTADSYCSLASALAYHAKFGNTAWAALADDAAREILLLKATRYIDARYGPELAGTRVRSDQALQAPRYGVSHEDGYLIDADAQLVILSRVCADLALKASTEDIYPDLTNAGVIASESVRVGSISTSKTYTGGRLPVKAYRLADDMIEQLLSWSGLSSQVVRS